MYFFATDSCNGGGSPIFFLWLLTGGPLLYPSDLEAKTDFELTESATRE